MLTDGSVFFFLYIISVTIIQNLNLKNTEKSNRKNWVNQMSRLMYCLCSLPTRWYSPFFLSADPIHVGTLYCWIECLLMIYIYRGRLYLRMHVCSRLLRSWLAVAVRGSIGESQQWRHAEMERATTRSIQMKLLYGLWTTLSYPCCFISLSSSFDRAGMHVPHIRPLFHGLERPSASSRNSNTFCRQKIWSIPLKKFFSTALR